MRKGNKEEAGTKVGKKERKRGEGNEIMRKGRMRGKGKKRCEVEKMERDEE